MKVAFNPVVNESTHTLILGTMPGEKSLEVLQYYGNKNNQFWRLIFTVFQTPFIDNYPDRLAFLLSKGIGLWDVLYSCERTGSLDSAIKNEVPNDFEYFFKKHPNVKRVFFSSKNAEKYFDKYSKRTESIRFKTLPSPSGANATMNFSQKLQIWENILSDN